MNDPSEAKEDSLLTKPRTPLLITKTGSAVCLCSPLSSFGVI